MVRAVAMGGLRLFLAIAAIVIFAETPVLAAERPNIVFILADDLGWADLGCYGNTYHQTPNLDRLAAGGMRFTNAYAASSVCSPTRSSIMSGKYPARNDLTVWLGGRTPPGRKLIHAPTVNHLAPEEVTIAEALKAAKYTTGAVGKWHLGGKPYLPENQGFDVNIAGTHAGSPAGGYFLPNKMNLPGAQKGEYLTDRLGDEGVKFIEANRDKPFFLYQSFHSVHTPIQGKKEIVEQYKGRMKPGQKNTNPTYAAMVYSLDENVGKIMKKLDELKLTDRTAVFFFSDNGGFHRVTCNEPLRAGKGYSYEGGHREPLIVRLPGKIKPGSVCDVPVISVDFYPTILELTGAKGDPKHNAQTDGVSIVPVLEATGVPEREAIYWHYPHYSPQGGTPSSAVRAGDFKLIEFFEDGHVELYNLKDDIGEKNDLAKSMPEKAKELHKMLLDWRGKMDAKLPSPNPNFGKPKSTSQAKKLAKPFDPTEEFPGFDVLDYVHLSKSGEGFQVESNQTGLALVKLEKPIEGKVTFRVKLTPATTFPSNGFLAFGDGPCDKEMVKCGLLVGGDYAAIIEGSYPSDDTAKLEMPLQGGRAYEMVVCADLASGIVVMTVGDRKITKKLTRKIGAVRYYGYSVIRTHSRFAPIEITESN